MKRSPLAKPTREQIERWNARQAANMLRRAQARRDNPVQKIGRNVTPRRNPIAQTGRKAWREGPALAQFRGVLRERSGGRCEAVSSVRPRTGQPVCSNTPHPGDHAHHCFPEDRDAGIHDPDRGLFLCAASHEWAHSFPADAKVAGLLRPDRATS